VSPSFGLGQKSKRTKRTPKVFAASDILSDIAPARSENSGEQMKTAATNGQWQIADAIAFDRKMPAFVGFF
jgi:hypothetical protein